ncbi:MAG: glycosyltransferase family 2 protein [Spongiibacteraceae bacterium]
MTIASDVCAVVPVYYPDLNNLDEMVTALLKQLTKVVLVNNSSETLSTLLNNESVIILNQSSNIGVASAFNLGFQYAIDHGISYVLLMDQDSVVSANMVSGLLGHYVGDYKQPQALAAVGPFHKDIRTGDAAKFIRCNKFYISKILPNGFESIECDFIISSGSLVPVSVFNDVGPMLDDLFIDCVDIEWCFRARSKGYMILGSKFSSMGHRIGDDQLNFLGKKITMHQPIRHYYFYRNLFFLLRKSYIPMIWRVQTVFKSLLQMVIFSTLTSQRIEHFKMIVKGAYHGLTANLGALR